MLPLFALMFVFLFGILSLALDAGHLFLVNLTVRSTVDAAVLAAGRTLGLQAQSLPPANSNNAAVKAAHDFAAANGFQTALNTTCDTYSTSQFSTTWYDVAASLGCGPGTGYTRRIDVYVPPQGPLTANCAATPFNCIQVKVTQQVQNYLFGALGIPFSTVSATATAYAQAPGSFSNYPAQNALYLYEKQAGCAGGSQCFNEANPPSRSNLSCAGSGNCPTLWVQNGTAPLIQGIDANLSGGTDTVAVQSRGDIVVQDTSGGLTICDPFNGGTCASGSAVGARGFALDTGAHLRCNGGTAQTPPLPACAGGASFGPLYGNGYSPFVSATWPPQVSLTGLSTCGYLVLNGEQVHSHAGLNAACDPGTSDIYTIKPGIYQYIVINHGQYEFAGGLFDITGSAPAAVIDHGREGSDFDLCNPNPGCTTTAAIWITRGSGSYTAAGGGGGSCAGGGGVQPGGGDLTQILGIGVAFKFESAAGGFVSSHAVTAIVLVGPGFGAMPAVNNVPLLFDMESTTSFIHLDATPPAFGYNPNRFQGIIYQNSNATAGGVEVNPGSAGSGYAPIIGQVLAYSFTTFGSAGTAVDFTKGLAGASMPVFSTGGKYEPSIMTGATLQPVAGDPTKEKLVITYWDEFDLDAFDVYVKINNGNAIYFSKGYWPASSTPPPGNIPGDANPAYPVTSSPPAGYTIVASSPKPDWKYTEPDGSTYEVSGDWAWGHQLDIVAAGGGWGTGFGNQADTITYTFPIPAGNTVTVTAYMTDGDFCGDFVTGTWTFYNIGTTTPGKQVAGNLHLEQ
jgi:Flp pilus assembly protein TadG